MKRIAKFMLVAIMAAVLVTFLSAHVWAGTPVGGPDDNVQVAQADSQGATAQPDQSVATPSSEGMQPSAETPENNGVPPEGFTPLPPEDQKQAQGWAKEQVISYYRAKSRGDKAEMRRALGLLESRVDRKIDKVEKAEQATASTVRKQGGEIAGLQTGQKNLATEVRSLAHDQTDQDKVLTKVLSKLGLDQNADPISNEPAPVRTVTTGSWLGKPNNMTKSWFIFIAVVGLACIYWNKRVRDDAKRTHTKLGMLSSWWLAIGAALLVLTVIGYLIACAVS